MHDIFDCAEKEKEKEKKKKKSKKQKKQNILLHDCVEDQNFTR